MGDELLNGQIQARYAKAVGLDSFARLVLAATDASLPREGLRQTFRPQKMNFASDVNQNTDQLFQNVQLFQNFTSSFLPRVHDLPPGKSCVSTMCSVHARTCSGTAVRSTALAGRASTPYPCRLALRLVQAAAGSRGRNYRLGLLQKFCTMGRVRAAASMAPLDSHFA